MPHILKISVGDLTACLRGVYYKKKNFKKPLLHPEIAKRWQLFGRFQEQGQDIQRYFIQQWKLQGILVSPEKSIPSNKYNLVGRYDAICKIKKSFILYEIKGVGEDFFNWVKHTLRPRKENRLQAILYHFFLKDYYPNLEVRIMYVNRKNYQIIQIPLRYSQSEIENLLKTAKLLKKCLEEDTLPPVVKTIVWNEEREKYDINLPAILCEYHALCLGDLYWYDKALDKLRQRNEDINNG